MMVQTNALEGKLSADHDADGCKDSSEDSDDDNDGVIDIADSCQFGEINWPSDANTDFDGDGCKDGYEMKMTMVMVC